MPKTGIEIDTREFQEAMKFYLKHSKRDLAFVVNKRAINVSFLTMKKTPSASAARINRDLRKRIAVDSRKGKKKPPLAALLIASGSDKIGGKKPARGLYGAAMKEEIERVIGRRQRTRAYIKSGFIKTIRDLERKVPGRQKRPPRGTQGFSKPAGEGRPARPGINPTAEVINHATNAGRIAGPALQKALNADAADMRRFTEKRLQKTANKFRG